MPDTNRHYWKSLVLATNIGLQCSGESSGMYYRQAVIIDTTLFSCLFNGIFMQIWCCNAAISFKFRSQYKTCRNVKCLGTHPDFFITYHEKLCLLYQAVRDGNSDIVFFWLPQSSCVQFYSLKLVTILNNKELTMSHSSKSFAHVTSRVSITTA